MGRISEELVAAEEYPPSAPIDEGQLLAQIGDGVLASIITEDLPITTEDTVTLPCIEGISLTFRLGWDNTYSIDGTREGPDFRVQHPRVTHDRLPEVVMATVIALCEAL